MERKKKKRNTEQNKYSLSLSKDLTCKSVSRNAYACKYLGQFTAAKHSSRDHLKTRESGNTISEYKEPEEVRNPHQAVKYKKKNALNCVQKRGKFLFLPSFENGATFISSSSNHEESNPIEQWKHSIINKC